MDVKESRTRIKARVWQTLAQSDLELKDLPKEDLEPLVEMVTDAALLEIDEEMGQSVAAESAKEEVAADDDEEVLWEGRPFLSISTRYIVTDERIRIIEGLLGKDREDIELVRIQDLDQSQSISERLLNVGDIHVRGHDRSHPQVTLRNVKDPQQVHEIVRRAILNARKKHGLIYREEM